MHEFLKPVHFTLENAWARINAFVLALLKTCDQAIVTEMKPHGERNHDWLENKAAAWFRDKMSEGQTGASQGDYRKTFYDDVIKHAKEVR